MSEWENNYSEQNEIEKEEFMYTQDKIVDVQVEPKSKPKRRTGAWLVLTVAVGLASFGGGSLYTSYQWINNQEVVNDTKVKDSENSTIAVPTKTSYTDTGVQGVNVAAVAKSAADAVVEISTEVVGRDNFYRPALQQGAGSGVILSEDGYIITNNHVIDQAQKITIRLTNGKEYQAELIGTDPQTDVAVLKIEPGEDKLKAAAIGDSSALEVGEVAVAIGNPLGELGGTVTNGIISALDREVTIGGRVMTLLQTNAAINPGNSGGGLFNSKGELVGVVVAKSAGLDVEGLGFAIPINKVKEIAGSLAENGYVAGRPALGVQVQVIDSWQTAMQYNAEQIGIHIRGFSEDGNAKDSGLQIGDIIVGIEDTQVNTMEDISNILSNYKVGDEVKLTISRNGKFINIPLKLSELKQQIQNPQSTTDNPEIDENKGK